MERIKAIETEYNGNLFRSRLEARWAVFFDTLGIPYVYEPEGYDLGDGILYLPDFYLPDAGQFFECKGIMTDTDMTKIRMLVEKTGKAVVIGYDNAQFQIVEDEYHDAFYKDEQARPSVYDKNGTVLAKCFKCDKYFFLNHYGSWYCRACGYYDGDSTARWIGRGDGEELDSSFSIAVSAFKQARFEHGQTPQDLKKKEMRADLEKWTPIKSVIGWGSRRDSASYTRLKKALHRCRIYWLQELTEMTERDLLDLPNIGKTSVDLLRRVLKENGLALRGETK